MDDDFKKNGFRFLDGGEVEFYCDAALFSPLSEGESVYVTGSFNNWLNTGDSSWQLERKSDGGCAFFVLRKPLPSVMIPGNSGYPEFRFFALSSESCRLLEELEENPQFSFMHNKLILRDGGETAEIARVNGRFNAIRPLSDFDLECPACRSEIANVRIVPGTRCLFRGYSPFKRSNPNLDTEDDRLRLVQKAFEVFKIQSDITLSGFEGAYSFNGEFLPDAIKRIEKRQNRLCVNIDYNLVYYHSDAVEYALTLKKIARFMLGHPGPFYIHCRLGSDRTGVTCAVFAALCGASWDDIAADYERTSDMGIGEYRSRRLLQYSLSKMTGRDPASSDDLRHQMQSFFIEENILTEEEIGRLANILNEAPEADDSEYFDFSGRHLCARRAAL